MGLNRVQIGMVGIFGGVCAFHAAAAYMCSLHGDSAASLLFNAVAVGEGFCSGMLVQKAADNVAIDDNTPTPSLV